MKATPSIKLLLSNLQLLDFPQSKDVTITAETFSMGKNKSKAFEHISHHLFHLYDSTQCETRFQGSWPAYEPQQAKTYRVAALAWIGDLKKSGILEGGPIIRKSLLDDCQGDRYEELMLALSNLVLSTVLSRKEDSCYTVFKETMEETPSADRVQALSLAYEASLRNVLNERSKLKAKWNALSHEFVQVEHENDILGDTVIEATSTRPDLQNPSKETRSLWQTNWIGDESALQLVMHGRQPKNDGDENESFENVLKTYKNLPVGTTPKNRAIHSQPPINVLKEAYDAQLLRSKAWQDVLGKLDQEHDGDGNATLPTTNSNNFVFSLNRHQAIELAKENPDIHGHLDTQDKDYEILQAQLQKELKQVKLSRKKAIGPTDGIPPVIPQLDLLSIKMQNVNETPSLKLPLKYGEKMERQNEEETFENTKSIMDETPIDQEAQSVQAVKTPDLTSHSVNMPSSVADDDDHYEAENLSELEFELNEFNPPLPLKAVKEYDLNEERAPSQSEVMAHDIPAIIDEDDMITKMVSSIANATDSPIKPRKEPALLKSTLLGKDVLDKPVHLARSRPMLRTPEPVQPDDYDSVFKSRPKIAHSPDWSPTKMRMDLDITMMSDMHDAELEDYS